MDNYGNRRHIRELLLICFNIFLIACVAISNIFPLGDTKDDQPVPKSLEIPLSIDEILTKSNLLGVKPYWFYQDFETGTHLLKINVCNGNMLLQHTDQDIYAPGINSTIIRTYNSFNNIGGEFGNGWTSNAGNSIRIYPIENNKVILFSSTGTIEVFNRQGNKHFSPPGYHAVLEKKDNRYVLRGNIGGVAYEFNQFDSLERIVDRNGNQQVFHYGDAGNILEVVDTVGQSTLFEYNDQGAIIQLQDRSQRLSKFSYDDLGNLVQYSNPVGNSTEYVYDGPSNQLSNLIESNGGSWAFEYDTQGRILVITNPLNNLYQYAYEENHTVITDPLGHNRSVSCDDRNRVVAVTEANGDTTRYTWDEFNNLTSVTNPTGDSFEYMWDGNSGLLLRVVDALGNTESYSYDSFHNLSSIIDPRGNITTITYDDEGANILKVNQTDGSEFTFSYDDKGNMVSFVDPNGNAKDSSNPAGKPYRFEYDHLGFITDVFDPLGNQWTYTWDESGNLLSILDTIGYETKYGYDEMDQLINITYHDSSQVDFTYDTLGNLTSMYDDRDTIAYTYNAIGQPEREISSRSGGEIIYEYDPFGSLVKMTREGGKVISYTYDKGGRLIQQSDTFSNDWPISYKYDAADQIVMIKYPNGDQTEYSYYSNGWLESMITKTSAGQIYNQYEYPSISEGGYDRNGNPLRLSRTYATFDEEGNLDWVSEQWEMQYDEMDQLTNLYTTDETGEWLYTVTLSYNPNGLWATRTYEDSERYQSWDYHYDAASRWVGVTFWDGRRKEISNDPNGRQIKFIEEYFDNDKNIVSYTTHFEYDAANRLSRVIDPTGRTFQLKYDGFNRLTEIISNKSLNNRELYYDLLGLSKEKQEETVHYMNDLAGNTRASWVEGDTAYFIHRDTRGFISHVSDELALAVDYCFMGNVQSSGDPGIIPFDPPLSDNYPTIELDDTWTASLIFLYSGKGWPNNSQVDLDNDQVDPRMVPKPPITLPPPRKPPTNLKTTTGGNDDCNNFRFNSILNKLRIILAILGAFAIEQGEMPDGTKYIESNPAGRMLETVRLLDEIRKYERNQPGECRDN